MNEGMLKAVAIFAAISVVIAGLGYLALGRLSEGEPTRADTTTHGIDRCGFGALDGKGRGAIETAKGNELVASTVLWYSWFTDGEGSGITVQSAVDACGFLGISVPAAGWFRFLYSEDGLTWTGFISDRNPEGAVRVGGSGGGFPTDKWVSDAYLFNVDGYEFRECTYPPPNDWENGDAWRPEAMPCTPGSARAIRSGAILAVEAFAEYGDIEGTHVVRIATDQVNLLDALPDKLQWQRGACKVGDTCLLNWEIPTDRDEDGNPAYFLTIFNENGHIPIPGYDRRPLNGTSGQERILITATMFSNNLETCQNRLWARIYTQLIPVASDQVAVQDSKLISVLPSESIPRVSGITFDKADYAEGDPVTVSWQAQGNITKFHVTITLNGMLLYDQDVGPDVRSVTVSAPIAGVGDVEVTPYLYCTPGEVSEVHFSVGNVYPGMCVLFPDLRECAGSDLLGIILAILGVLLVAGALAFVAWILGKLDLDIPGWLRLLILFLTGAAAAAVAISMGMFDRVLRGL